jgi:hypothetical protein
VGSGQIIINRFVGIKSSFPTGNSCKSVKLGVMVMLNFAKCHIWHHFIPPVIVILHYLHLDH